MDSADAHRDKAVRLLLKSAGSTMGSEDYRAFHNSSKQVVELRDEASKLYRASDAKIVREPRTYRKDGSQSYFLDLAASNDTLGGRDARARLAAHSNEVAFEISAGTPEGRVAESMIREWTRQDDPVIHERRARELISLTRDSRAVSSAGGTSITATGGSAAALVPPVFVQDMFAQYLGRATFANAISTHTLPAYGLTVALPVLQSDAGVSNQGPDGAALNETDPTAAFITSPVETFAGTVTISQQLLDRSGALGSDVTFDYAIGKQLGIDFARSLDAYALNTAISSGPTIIYNAASFALSTTNGVAGFTDKLAQAAANIRGTAGGYLEPTSAFFSPNRWSFIANWGDGGARPVTLPYPYPVATNDDVRRYGDTNQEWQGLHCHVDPNIPNFGTTNEDQVVVVDETEVHLWKSTPVLQTIIGPSAGSLEVTVRLYGYGATIVRWPSACQTVTGTGLAAPSF